MILQARFQALKLNRPVVVALDPDNGAVSIRTSTLAGTIDCAADATEAFRQLDLSRYPHVSMTSTAQRFVWLPSGQLRGCSGEWLGEAVVIALRDTKHVHWVVASSGGEVSSR